MPVPARPVLRTARHRVAVVVALLSAVPGLAVAGTAPAAAATPVTVSIGGGLPVRAGYTGQGGLYTPHVSTAPCGSVEADRVRVRDFTVTVRRDGDDEVVARSREQFALLRLDPGRYRVSTRLRYSYRGATRTLDQVRTAEITRKTDATTVSRPELAAVRTGMTLAQVRKIVGGPGHHQDGTLWMEGLRFEHGVSIAFAHGRVSGVWDTRNVYDWC